jgi:hypothetical protein
LIRLLAVAALAVLLTACVTTKKDDSDVLSPGFRPVHYGTFAPFVGLPL